jgi:hypothetical protein
MGWVSKKGSDVSVSATGDRFNGKEAGFTLISVDKV